MSSMIPNRRRLLAIFGAGVAAGVAGCVGALEDVTNGGGETWTSRRTLEGGVLDEEEGYQTEAQLLELVNRRLNDRRLEEGVGRVDYDVSLESALSGEARMEPSEAPTGVDTGGDAFYCGGTTVKAHTTVVYESKYDEEDGVLINANRETIAEDIASEMEASDEFHEVLYDPDHESHAARVNIGDRGEVYIPQVFCTP